MQQLAENLFLRVESVELRYHLVSLSGTCYLDRRDRALSLGVGTRIWIDVWARHVEELMTQATIPSWAIHRRA